MIFDAWPHVVGEEVAKRTEPLFFEHGVLFVRVPDSVWAQHISLQKKSIISSLNRKTRTRLLKDLRFQSGPVRAAVLSAPKTEKECPWQQVRLTPAEEKAVEEALSRSSLAPGLRDSLGRALIAQKKRQKRLIEQGYRECNSCRLLFPPAGSATVCGFCRQQV